MSHTFILLLILLSQLCTLLPKALKWISMLSTQLSRSHTYNFLYCLHFSLFLYSSVRLSLHLQAHAGVHHFRRMCVSVCVCVCESPFLSSHSIPHSCWTLDTHLYTHQHLRFSLFPFSSSSSIHLFSLAILTTHTPFSLLIFHYVFSFSLPFSFPSLTPSLVLSFTLPPQCVV